MQEGLATLIRQKIAKAEKITMDESHAGKLARVVLTKGEDKNPIRILRCAKLHI